MDETTKKPMSDEERRKKFEAALKEVCDTYADALQHLAEGDRTQEKHTEEKEDNIA
jgi:hypothetical protein